MVNGDIVKQRRLELGYSQTELAERCGYASKTFICHLEKGDIKDIPLSKAVLLAKALELTPTELCKGNE